MEHKKGYRVTRYPRVFRMLKVGQRDPWVLGCHSQWCLKRRGWVGLLKGSLAGAIVPSSGTQPPTRIRRDGVLPCKVVITSTHALARHPKGRPMVKALTNLNTQG